MLQIMFQSVDIWLFYHETRKRGGGAVLTRAALCVSAVFAVLVWMSGCLSVCHTPVLCLNG